MSAVDQSGESVGRLDDDPQCISQGGRDSSRIDACTGHETAQYLAFMTANRSRRWSWRGRLLVSALIAVLAMVVLALRPVFDPEAEIARPSEVRIPPLSRADSARRFAVYVADFGYHTAIFVEQPHSWTRVHADTEPDAEGRFVEYAWGDRRFYMESRYAPWSVFATLLLPTEGVAYVAHHANAPDHLRGWRSLHRRDVAATDMVALVTQLERWMVRDSLGARHDAFPKVPRYRGRFHRAFGRYTWWQNCNRWTLAQLAVINASRERAIVVTPSHVVSNLNGFSSVSFALSRVAAEGPHDRPDNIP